MKNMQVSWQSAVKGDLIIYPGIVCKKKEDLFIQLPRGLLCAFSKINKR